MPALLGAVALENGSLVAHHRIPTKTPVNGYQPWRECEALIRTALQKGRSEVG